METGILPSLLGEPHVYKDQEALTNGSNGNDEHRAVSVLSLYIYSLQHGYGTCFLKWKIGSLVHNFNVRCQINEHFFFNFQSFMFNIYKTHAFIFMDNIYYTK